MTTLRNRTIHLVDIENLAGEPRPCRATVEALRTLYLHLVQPGPRDHVVLACNHGACLDVGLGWPGARLILRSGPDGADRALLGVLSSEHVEARYLAAVIASGDGIFTPAAGHLASAGLGVTVVSRRLSLSKRLRMAAQQVLTFDWPISEAEAA